MTRMVRLAPVGSSLRLTAVAAGGALLAACIGGNDDGADEDGQPGRHAVGAETLPPLPDRRHGPRPDAARRGRRLGRRRARRRHGHRRRARHGLRGLRRLPRRRRRLPVATPTTSSCAPGWSSTGWRPVRPGVDRDVLSASCSRRYLGDLTPGFERANPPADDLDERRSAEHRRVHRTDQPGGRRQPARGDRRRHRRTRRRPSASCSSTRQRSTPRRSVPIPTDTAAVSSCIASVGAEWRAFG